MNMEFIVDSEFGGEDAEKLKQALEITSERVTFPSSWRLKNKDEPSGTKVLLSDAMENDKLCNGGEEMTQEQPQVDSTAQAMSEQPPKLNPFASPFIPKGMPSPGMDVSMELPPTAVTVQTQPVVPAPVQHAIPQQISPRPGYQVMVNGSRRDMPIPRQPPMMEQQSRSMPPMASLANADSLNSAYMSSMGPIHAVTSYQDSHQPTIQAARGLFSQPPPLIHGPHDSRQHNQHHPGRQTHHSGPVHHHGYRATNDTVPGALLGNMVASHPAMSHYMTTAHPPGVPIPGLPGAPIGIVTAPHSPNMAASVPTPSHMASAVRPMPTHQIKLLKKTTTPDSGPMDTSTGSFNNASNVTEVPAASNITEVPAASNVAEVPATSNMPVTGNVPVSSNVAEVVPVASDVVDVNDKSASVKVEAEAAGKGSNGISEDTGSFFLQFGDYIPNKTNTENKSVHFVPPGKTASSSGKSANKSLDISTKPAHATPTPVTKVTEEAKADTEVSNVKVAESKASPQLTRDAQPQTNGTIKSPPVAANGSSSRTSSPQTTATSPATDNVTLVSPPAPQLAPKSWANLFANSSSTGTKPAEPPSVVKKEVPPLAVSNGSSKEMGAILANLKLSQHTVPLQARRLVNQANWCYVNATLQALLACPPFYHLLKALPAFPPLSNRQSVTPVLDAMVEFVTEFGEFKPEKQTDKVKKRRDLRSGDPFEPLSVYNVLSIMKTSDSMFIRGKQEDAEEFLTCLLNKMNEEVAEVIKQYEKKNAPPEAVMNGHESGSSDHEEDDGQDWEQVGPKNKSVVTHSNVDKTSTPILQIFGGQLRSSLHTGGNNPESVTLEQFFTVPLNVQTNKTVEEALHAFVSKESIDDYTCPQTKQELDAHRKLTFEQLPPILILHLKCFVYDKDKHGGSQKVLHNMNFSENLDFDKELLSKKHVPKSHRSYTLFAVVYHSGTKTTGGHYHTDVYHTGVKSWVRFDDNSTTPITHNDVFNFKHPSVPYLLYYKRADTQAPPSGLHKHGAVNSN